MKKQNQSPIIGYKITLVNNARLNEEVRLYLNAEVEGVRRVTQWVWVSRRASRAVRKARLMAETNSNVMLFAVREDGTHSPIPFRSRASFVLVPESPYKPAVANAIEVNHG